MNQIAELAPLLLFFVTYQMNGTTLSLGDFEYQFDGIYSATAVLMLATAVQLAATRLLKGRLERRLIVLGLAVFVFGGATLALRNQLFIQWKPTIFNWGLAIFFALTRLRTGQSALQTAMDGQLQLPPQAWLRLDGVWTGYFLAVGALNLIVAFNFSESAWVSYKLWSAIGFTVLLSVVTVVMLNPYIREADGEPPARPD